MEEINNDKLDQLLEELSDILLVFDKERKRIEAVKGIDQNGNLQTVPPNKEHGSDFMRVDKNGDIFSNFFSNFLRQLTPPHAFPFSKFRWLPRQSWQNSYSNK